MADADVEVLEAGPREPGRRPRWLPVAVLVAVAAVVLTLVSRPAFLDAPGAVDPTPGAASTAPTPDSTSAPRSPAQYRRAAIVGQPPAVLHLRAPRIPGFDAGFLVLRSRESLYRVRLDDGRISATPAALPSGSYRSVLVAGRDATVLRSSGGAGILVPNDRAATLKGGLTTDGNQLLPGAGGTFWVRSVVREDAVVMTRIRSDGTETDQHVSSVGTFSADGVGGLLLSDTGGVWDLRRDEQRVTRWHRLTDGEVTAVGRRYLLFMECDDGHVCQGIRYDRTTGERTRLAKLTRRMAAGGSVSADGRYATELTSIDSRVSVGIVDLGSGRTVTSFPVDNYTPSDLSNVTVWSPQGHGLLAISGGDLVRVDVPSGKLTVVGLDLGRLRQLSRAPDA